MITIFSYFEGYRTMHSCNIRSYIFDFVAPLPGNRCCHGNRFVPHWFGGRNKRKYEV